MEEPKLKKLADDQLATFDTDYVGGQRWDSLKAFMDAHFADRPVRVLDIGGGNGVFADKLLEAFPHASVTVLDNAEVLLDQNKPNPRKRLLLSSVEDVSQQLNGELYDLITINWVLHHLVQDGYQPTADGVTETLVTLQENLAPNGMLSIFENLYDGALVDGLPSKAIFHLTSLQIAALAPLFRRLGANTAGVGVCFRSDKQWKQIFDASGLSLESETFCDNLQVSPIKRMALLLKPIRVVHYGLS